MGYFQDRTGILKRITVNEASDHDNYSHGPGAFLLPKINQPADDDPRLTTKHGLSKADTLRKAVDELISKDKTGRNGT